MDFVSSTMAAGDKAGREKIGIVMYKTIFVINIIIYMCLQHSNVL